MSKVKVEQEALELSFEENIQFEDIKTTTEWFRYWFHNFRSQNIRRVTRMKYHYVYINLAKSELDKLDIRDVKRVHVQKYMNEYGENRAKQTVMDHIQYLRSLFSDALSEGLIERDPTRNITLTFKEQSMNAEERKELRDEKKWLEIDEYQKLKYYLIFNLDKMFKVYDKPKKAFHSDTTYFTLIFLALKTGARLSELIAITRDDLDFRNNIINLDKTWDYKFKSGFAPMKNMSSIREIQVDEETMDVLKKYLEWLDGSEKEMKFNTLFILKSRDFHNSTANNKLAEILDELDIQRISMHKLRHTHASYLIAKDIPLQVVAKRLGHTDTNMISKVYGHLLQETERNGNRRILELI